MLNKKELELLNKIKSKSVYEKKFFEKKYELKWFDELKKRRYFKPNPDTRPQETKDKGFYSIPMWDILPYLEKVSNQVKQPGNERFIGELLKIIKDVTNFHVKHKKVLDNYRTWWYFVKILCNIPNDKINNETIDLITIWLDSRFDTNLTGSEILDRFLPKFLDSNKKEDIQKTERIINLITKIKWDYKYKGKEKVRLSKKRSSIISKPEDKRTEEEKLSISFFNPEEKEPHFFIDQYLMFDTFLKKGIAKKIGEKSSIGIIFSFVDKLKNIIEKQFNRDEDLSYMWLESFFYKTESVLDIKQLISLIVANIIIGKVENKNKKEVNIILNKFLSDEYKYFIFKRIVLFVIGKNWDKYKDIFWELIDSDKEGLYFNNQYYEPEIYGIIENNIEKFSKEEKEKLIKIVEEKVPNKPHPKEEYRNYYEAYKKQRWYSAVKNDPIFVILYEQQKEITKEEEEIEFKESSTKWGPGPSPLNKEEILKKPNEGLVQYLKDFRAVNYWKGPTIGGLADLLKLVAEEEPDKFTDNLLPFLNCGFLYVYEILWGFEEVLKKGKIIEWGKVLNFISEFILDKNFWDDNYIIEGDDWNVDHLWIIGKFGTLIKTGVKDYSRSFPEENFLYIKELIFQILDKIFINDNTKIKESEKIEKDFVNDALNSTLGKLIEGLIHLSFRMNNYESETDKIIEENWKEKILKKYDEILRNDILEGFVWLGFYLPRFYYYLDKSWVKSKIIEINKIDNKKWSAFMEGYLFNSEVYKELYELMSENYIKAIDQELENDYITNHLTQHICIEYLNEDLDINDRNSLFNKILSKWDKKHIKSIINYFWMLEDSPSNKKRSEIDTKDLIKRKGKIISFWRWVDENKFKGKKGKNLSNESKEIASDLSKLMVFLPEINDKNLKWLLLSATYIHTGFNSPGFIKYLDFLKDKNDSVKYVGKIFIKILDNYTPDYNQEHIRGIVDYLYKNDYQEEADEICDHYALRGYEFLRDIYEKNHIN
jgi:hypothetical protein